MGLEEKLAHSFKELESRVIDAAMFGQKDQLRVTVSWIDLYKSRLPPTKEAAVDFAKQYFVPLYARLVEAAKVLGAQEMKHSYDNAWRMVFRKYSQEHGLAYCGGQL